MKTHPDSAQLLSFVGTVFGFVLANYDRLAACACALVGLGYTVWKWRREYTGERRRRARD